MEGITHISDEGHHAAGRSWAITLKLLAIAKRNGMAVETRVHPTFIQSDHPLANVSGSFKPYTCTGRLQGK